MKTFEELKTEAAQELIEVVEDRIKRAITVINCKIDQRMGWVKRREEEIRELQLIEAALSDAHRDNKRHKIEALVAEIDGFDAKNEGRSRNGNY